MFKLLVAIIVALSSATASAEDVPYLPEIALALTIADWGQTLDISEKCQKDFNYWESNPILGRCPSRGKVNTYFAITTAAAYAFAKYGPEEYRGVFTVLWTSLEIAVVGHNAYIGYKVKF